MVYLASFCMIKYFTLTTCHGSTLSFHLTSKSQPIITILGTSVILDICQKLPANFWCELFQQNFHPPKFCCIIYSIASYLIAKAITKGSNYVARNLEWQAVDTVWFTSTWFDHLHITKSCDIVNFMLYVLLKSIDPTLPKLDTRWA